MCSFQVDPSSFFYLKSISSRSWNLPKRRRTDFQSFNCPFLRYLCLYKIKQSCKFRLTEDSVLSTAIIAWARKDLELKSVNLEAGRGRRRSINSGWGKCIFRQDLHTAAGWDHVYSPIGAYGADSTPHSRKYARADNQVWRRAMFQTRFRSTKAAARCFATWPFICRIALSLETRVSTFLVELKANRKFLKLSKISCVTCIRPCMLMLSKFSTQESDKNRIRAPCGANNSK